MIVYVFTVCGAAVFAVFQTLGERNCVDGFHPRRRAAAGFTPLKSAATFTAVLGGDLHALTEGSGHDREGRAEHQDGYTATNDLLKRGKEN